MSCSQDYRSATYSTCTPSSMPPYDWSRTQRTRRDRVTPLLRDRHWLPIKQRIDYMMMVHRCLNGRAPSYLVEFITPSAAAHTRAGLRSAQLGSALVFITRAFAVAAPRAWNSLPLSLRATVSADCFTRNLKTFLYNAAFIPYHFFTFLLFTVLGALVAYAFTALTST